MRIIYYVLVGGVSAMVTWGFSAVILKLSHRYQLYPKIRSRDVHTQPTPRLGGVAMFLGVLVAMGVASLVPQLQPVFEDPEQILTILAAAFVIVVLGVIDDIWDLSWLTKLAGQIIVAGILAFGGTQILAIPFGGIIILSSFQ
ncbi:MAG: UDP-GlcNAc:undecaprenyl-phosphate/decaprenyl-phosphate GlcNAc-phosphate transferase [Actinomycetota bacterium]|nr:UDP-GlcNAc:undecaprenyl-phosphate/decaprenyl-phosphate GlcNAc-phosphate transferase [Actinomycetota bacterium]